MNHTQTTHGFPAMKASRSVATTDAEVRPVRVGLGTLDTPMSKAQALRWGQRNIPADLKKAGFQTSVFTSDPDIHGGTFYRINHSK